MTTVSGSKCKLARTPPNREEYMSAEASDTPILDLLGRMTADSMQTSTLDEQTLMLVRGAALVAVDAPPASSPTR
jgi:hypothetical protein